MSVLKDLCNFYYNEKHVVIMCLTAAESFLVELRILIFFHVLQLQRKHPYMNLQYHRYIYCSNNQSVKSTIILSYSHVGQVGPFRHLHKSLLNQGEEWW